MAPPRAIALLGLAGWLGSACGDSVEGVAPVGGERPSTVELERFARRLHLDLTGRPASDAFLAEAVAELDGAERAAGGAAPARAALADRLIESQEFAQTVVDELANRVYGGEDPGDRYRLLCSVARDEVAACSACGDAPDDPCSGCDCAPVVAFAADRQGILDAPADLESGEATTGEVERRFASSPVLSAFSDPETLADLLFELFLGRSAEADEQANAEAMIIGSLIPGRPAGLLFHRHGGSYRELVAILFESEVYREAAVSAVFSRYLGRPARLAEMAHFSAELDPERPDVRPVVRAVVSSQEYFEQ